jgi:hypothetical protein
LTFEQSSAVKFYPPEANFTFHVPSFWERYGLTLGGGVTALAFGATGLVFHRLARFWAGLRTVVEWPTETLAAALPALPPLALKGLNLLTGFVLWPLAFYLVLGLAAGAAARISITPWPEPGKEPDGLLYDVAEIDHERRGRERGWAARRQTLWGFIAVYGYAFVPLVAGAYAAFALVKLNEKAGYLPLALADPAGVRASGRRSSGSGCSCSARS